MKLEYVKRTCKSNRQKLLNRALAEELECLRKEDIFLFVKVLNKIQDDILKENKYTLTYHL